MKLVLFKTAWQHIKKRAFRKFCPVLLKKSLTINGKLWCNARNQSGSDLVLFVGVDRRAGKRKERKEKIERKRKIERDKGRKDIGKDKRQ